MKIEPVTTVLRVAVPSPLRSLFDYLPAAGERELPQIGSRVLVPFGRRQVVGVVLEQTSHSDMEPARLKTIVQVLDHSSLLPAPVLRLLAWARRYYQHPPGDVYLSALPVALRQGKAAELKIPKRWHALPDAPEKLDALRRRAPKQALLLEALQQVAGGLGQEELTAISSGWQAGMRSMQQKGWVEQRADTETQPTPIAAQLQLTEAQQQAVAAIAKADEIYQTFLLDGVTGSGKTEVYLRSAARQLQAGRQVLVLVPEIGLTPQLLQRFSQRLGVPIATLHSGLADGERMNNWLAAAQGHARVIIGTRSAVFTPMPELGLIIIDEEHDGSFKQQDGFRYSARDVAVMRAYIDQVPIVLGTATPSLESLANVEQGRYRLLELPQRAAASAPKMGLIDLRKQRLDAGLSISLREAMLEHLQQGSQVLLFLNRRGYAPVLLCHECGWISQCRRCDARMSLHAGQQRIRCNHCGIDVRVPRHCPDCGSHDLRPLGQGTERVEERLQEIFKDVPILRVDRDSTRRKGAMQAMLDEIHKGEPCILIGTQMLAKGHHFPDVTLVGILDADQGLFSVDFRAAERLAQQLIQVAGRAGRAERPGTVLIQTHAPDHPLLQILLRKGYQAFARAALAERREAAYPPYAYMALLRAEAHQAEQARAFLQEARALAQPLAAPQLMLLGPVPAPMERRAGRSRAQLLLQAEGREPLHKLLEAWLPQLDTLKSGRKVRWSLDVDPYDLY